MMGSIMLNGQMLGTDEPLGEPQKTDDMESQDDSQILGIMFCEFHDKEGPKIVVQVD